MACESRTEACIQLQTCWSTDLEPEVAEACLRNDPSLTGVASALQSAMRELLPRRHVTLFDLLAKPRRACRTGNVLAAANATLCSTRSVVADRA